MDDRFNPLAPRQRNAYEDRFNLLVLRIETDMNDGKGTSERAVDTGGFFLIELRSDPSNPPLISFPIRRANADSSH